MKNLIIIGAGGMGRTLYCIAKDSVGYKTEFVVKGFIDDNIHQLNSFSGYPPILGTIDDYQIENNDVFVCSVGETATKELLCEKLKKEGAVFQTLIHKTAIVRQNAVIGKGCIICEYAAVGADCQVGEDTLIQPYATIGHDCKVGKYVRIDTRVTLVGGVVVEDRVTIHTSAVLNHHVVVGEGAKVAACSFVIKKVKPGTTVMGNPAKVIKLLETAE